MYSRDFMPSFMSFINEVEEELVRNRHANQMEFFKETFKHQIAAYFAEAKWRCRTYSPTLEEYLRVSLASGGCTTISCLCLCLRGEVTKDTLDWVLSWPNIVKAAATISRLQNDIMSSQFEQQRMHVSSGVQCCMNNNGVTEKEVISRLTEIIAGTWKDVNKECLAPSNHDHKHANAMLLEFTRASEVIYKYEDSFTHPGKHMKNSITKLLVDPIRV